MKESCARFVESAFRGADIYKIDTLKAVGRMQPCYFSNEQVSRFENSQCRSKKQNNGIIVRFSRVYYFVGLVSQTR